MIRNSLLKWLTASKETPLLDALGQSRFATQSMNDTESESGVRLLFDWSSCCYILSDQWALKTAASLEGFDSPPPTSAAGQWRPSYRAFFASLDCPGNRILNLYVYDTESEKVRQLHLDEGYTSELVGTLQDFVSAFYTLDQTGIFVGVGEYDDEGEAYEREDKLLNKGRTLIELKWREI